MYFRCETAFDTGGFKKKFKIIALMTQAKDPLGKLYRRKIAEFVFPGHRRNFVSIKTTFNK